MDKTLDSSRERRAQKRPHSPKDEITPSPANLEAPVSEPGNILDLNEKRDKLLRLLGGKKRKNETAATRWLERARCHGDEEKVSTELECQFNESLTHKLSGASRRHVGIGFKDTPPSPPPTTFSENPNIPPVGVCTDPKIGVQNLSSDSKLGGGAYAHPPMQPGVHSSNQPSIVASLSNRASVPSLSGRSSMTSRQSYRPPMPYQGYGMGPQDMRGPLNYDYQAPYGVAGCVPPPPPNYGSGYNHPPPPNALYGRPQLPSPPGPPHVEHNDQAKQRQGVKSKDAFYAQFKKSS